MMIVEYSRYCELYSMLELDVSGAFQNLQQQEGGESRWRQSGSTLTQSLTKEEVSTASLVSSEHLDYSNATYVREAAVAMTLLPAVVIRYYIREASARFSRIATND